MPPPEKRRAAPGRTARASKKENEHSPETGTAADPLQTEAPPRIGPVSSPDELPAVAAYLKRVGAKMRGMKVAVIKVAVNGYPKEVGRIAFDLSTGSVEPKGEAEPPTQEEADAIAAEIKRATFPKLVTLECISEPPPGVDLNDRSAFICHDFDGRVVMIHARYENDDGTKGFLPWTKWSDGQWRMMEPDVLPFYGLPGYRDKAILVLHEGEKAAARLQRLQSGEESADRFPWFRDLKDAHHVGWVGGVHALNRSEWSRLAACGWRRVLIVADNDDNGHGLKATRRIAREFPANVQIVAFDERFKDGFDLGDPWPEEQFDDEGRYTGPSLRDCLLPATQATIEIPPEGRGRPTRVLRDEYARLVAYTADPPRIFYRDNPSRDMRPETFNIRVAPFSHAKDTAMLVWSHLACQHDRMVYRPGSRPGTLNIDGSRCFNVYEGAQIVPVENGDPKLWLEFLEHLFPIQGERKLVMRWLATLITKPEIRMVYGLLLISGQQGVGKNTLGNILRLLLGRQNVSFPSESSVVKSDFNGWLARKRLIFISEIYSGHSRKAYDKIKPYVTDDEVEINEKGVNQYSIDNYAHFIACSNSEKALHLDDEDRRWMVPTVAEETKPDTFWRDLYAWLAADGPGIILRWALDHGDYERTGAIAPLSPRKLDIVQESRTEGKKLAHSLGEWLAGRSDKVTLRLSHIREWIAAERRITDLSNPRLEAGSTITAVFKKVPGITVWADKKRPKFGPIRDTIIMNFDPGPEATWEEVQSQVKLTDLAKLKTLTEEPM